MTQNPFQMFEQNKTSTAPEKAGEKFKELISSSDVFVFMKGRPEFPQCGFSANTVAILQKLGVTFNTFDILEDHVMRNAVKELSGWPTYPQIYIKGQLIGGNDILTEMYQNGELQEMLGK